MIKLCKAEGVPSAQLDLHSTFPMPGDLQPNPDWSRLPLFDRKDWTGVRFGDVVQNVNETEAKPGRGGHRADYHVIKAFGKKMAVWWACGLRPSPLLPLPAGAPRRHLPCRASSS